MNIDQLHRYITQNMRMAHVYQPVMLRELLRSGSEASVEQNAKAQLNGSGLKTMSDPTCASAA
jgi:hypothetical protein